MVALAAAFVAEQPTQNSRWTPLAATYSGLLVALGFAFGTQLLFSGNPTAQVLSFVLTVGLIRYVATPLAVSWLLHRDFGGAQPPPEKKPREEPPAPPPSDVVPIRWLPKVDAFGRERSFGGI